MELRVNRLHANDESTIGVLSDDMGFLCFTLEDQPQTVKVYGETRIPAGRYRVTLRNEGGFHKRYARKFPSFHNGMLWVRDVPGFEYILIHIGNDDDDTAGCLLVGDTVQQNVTKPGFIGASTEAYERVYRSVAEALARDEEVWITYEDESAPIT